MSKIDLSDLNYKVGSAAIVSAKVLPMKFHNLVSIITEAQARAKDTKGIRKVISALQMQRYIVLLDKDEKEFAITDEMQLLLPANLGKRLFNGMNYTGDKQGEIIKEGDGISTSVVYKLGTPIETNGESIKELEFHAQLYSNIEDVLAEDLPHEQTMMLISTVAKPLGTTLQALPSWASNEITVADGMFVMTKILPGFLE